MTEIGLSRILETVLYCSGEDELESMRTFYGSTLGLRAVGLGGGSFRLGDHLLLIFDRERSTVQDWPPPHGSTGPGHTCFVADKGTYSQWKERLSEQGLKVRHETTWPNGVRSFYLDDPAGNVIEIADGDLWPS